MAQGKRLYRSESDRVVAGVCGGLAEYFNVDSVVVRLVFLALLFWGGVSLWIYLIMAIIVPTQSKVGQPTEKTVHENAATYHEQVKSGAERFRQEFSIHRDRARMWFGVGLLVLGLLIFLNNFGLMPFSFINGLAKLWPVIIILLGVVILNRRHE